MRVNEIVAKILANRELEDPQKLAEFFNPTHPIDIPSPFDSAKVIKLITKHITRGNKIAIYGDYDVDGVCATAILWETLYQDYKNVFPHIPHRESEGYGLSIKGIDHCLALGAQLIIAVDNGITAVEQAAYCKKMECDLVIIDHHESDKKLPDAVGLLHSTSTCAAALTWLFCRDYQAAKNLASNIEHLSLVALAVVCDMVPLLGINRSFVKHGLVELNKTTRPGLLSLFEVARIKLGKIGSYQAGFMIGPRLNSMGRLEHAIDSLRLVCTKDILKAGELARLLNDTNRQRQIETELSIKHALVKMADVEVSGILVAADQSYNPGIIGLIASKLVEHHYRPSLVISVGETESKGSGRSITGFHLTDYLRQHNDLFISLGGHAMACGFTIETSKLPQLAEILSKSRIEEELLVRKQRVDVEIDLSDVSYELVNQLEALQPFGLGNPTPIFQSRTSVLEPKWIGQEKKHLKFRASDIEAIWFNVSSKLSLKEENLNIVYSIDRDIWNGQERLQLMIKDMYV